MESYRSCLTVQKWIWQSNIKYTADMENKQLKQQVKGLVLLVMLWVLHGLLLRLGRLSTLRVFLNLPPWPKLVLKLLLLNLSLKIPSNLCQDIFNTGLSILQSEAAAYDFSLPIFSLRKGRGTSTHDLLLFLPCENPPWLVTRSTSYIEKKSILSFFNETISWYWRTWLDPNLCVCICACV